MFPDMLAVKHLKPIARNFPCSQQSASFLDPLSLLTAHSLAGGYSYRAIHAASEAHQSRGARGTRVRGTQANILDKV